MMLDGVMASSSLHQGMSFTKAYDSVQVGLRADWMKCHLGSHGSMLLFLATADEPVINADTR
jgi:hypothetical protein